MYSISLFPRGKQQRLRFWSLMNSWSYIKFFEVFRNLPKSLKVSHKIGSHMKSCEVSTSLTKSDELSWSLLKSHKITRSLVKSAEVFAAPWIVLKKSKRFIIRLVNQKFAEKINQLSGRILGKKRNCRTPVYSPYSQAMSQLSLRTFWLFQVYYRLVFQYISWSTANVSVSNSKVQILHCTSKVKYNEVFRPYC
jgi:hypothetical protein